MRVPASFRILREGSGDIVAFAPFTRNWCVERFFDAIAASDIPVGRVRFIAYVDSDDAELLASVERCALAVPFAEVAVHCSGWTPPGEYAKSAQRRTRHSAMRCASAGLIPDAEHLLLLEDDTLVHPDSWKLLTDARKHYDWVSGFEVGRWGVKAPGVWRIYDGTMIAPKPGKKHEPVSATGLYLVLTTPAIYKRVRWDEWDNRYGHDVSCTYALSLAGLNLGVEWRARCVHMTETGDLTCEHAVAYMRKVGPMRHRDITPRGFIEYDDPGPHEPASGVTFQDEEGIVRGKVYYAPHRVVVGGVIKYGKKSPIPYDEALALARVGLICDPALSFDPREETKPDIPGEHKGLIEPHPDDGLVCPECGREFKTAAGKAAHMRAKHDA